uniref:Uncharacterized protein n=1 Tax=Rhizophora mucronata TaxID=61149 RepID=A0A2P2J3C5_RHIMU
MTTNKTWRWSHITARQTTLERQTDISLFLSQTHTHALFLY